MKPAWWKSSVVYQIYSRSFCDGNGDLVFRCPAPYVFRVAEVHPITNFVLRHIRQLALSSARDLQPTRQQIFPRPIERAC